MDGIERFIKTLEGHSISGKLWIDGSFLTEKIEPDDADLVIEFDASQYDDGTDLTRMLLQKIASELEEDREYFKGHYYCDPYPIAIFQPQETPLYETTEKNMKYWIKQFGSDRRDRPKGIAVVEIGAK